MNPSTQSFLAISAPILILASGITVWCANPKRKPNQAVLLITTHAAIWLLLREICSFYSPNIFWLRVCVCIGSLILGHLVYTTETIISNSWKINSPGFKLIILSSLVLAILPWTNSFVHANSTAKHEINGIGYFAYLGLNGGSYIVFTILVGLRISQLNGVKKHEATSIAYPAAALGIAILLLMLIRKLTPITIPRASSSILVLAFTVWLSYSITATKIFDAQHIFRSISIYVASILLPISTAAIATHLSPIQIPLHITLLSCCAIAIVINKLLSSRIEATAPSKHNTDLLRQKIHEIAHQHADETSLRHSLSISIGDWADAEALIMLTDTEDSKEDSSLTLSADSPVFISLLEVRWTTPERLQRERSSSLHGPLIEYMTKNNLALIVVSKGQTPTIVALKKRRNHKPFTYPEIQQLQEFASLTELALTRARLTSQAVHADRLVTVGILGASLAHEIRNPLYAIKAFAELLPVHYDREDFRLQFTGMVNTEAARIDSLLSDMMNLSKPRQTCIAPTYLNAVVESSLDLVCHKARSHEVIVKRNISAEFDVLTTDASFIKQVILNLCINAIQAQCNAPHPRWVQVSTANINKGYEITVSDNGPGIAPHLREKLFRRFQTGSAQGTGLGLCISRDLITNLGGTLKVDPPVPGKGATFRVVLPSPYEVEEDSPVTTTSAA